MGFWNALSGTIPGPLLAKLPRRYDVIGTVAVIAIPEELDPFKHTIAEALLAHRRSVRTVLNKTGILDGARRVARYEALAGSETVTTHREYGFEYRVDVLTSFFAPRLQTERNRVTMQVLPGERVLVPFAGVGPFVVPAAARGARIVAIEQNPDAFRWLEENIEKNNVGDRVVTVLGDAFDRSIIPSMEFDRMILPAPYGMDGIFPVLEPCLRPGGMAHLYTFRNREQVHALAADLEQSGHAVTRIRKCGNVAPAVARWVLDIGKKGE